MADGHASPLDLLPSSLNKSLAPNIIHEAIQQGEWRSSHLEKLWKDFDSDELPSLRFGFVQPMAPVTYKETLDLTKLTLKCLGNERWMHLISPKYRHVPHLLAALDAAKSLYDIPQELIDLRQPNSISLISYPANWSMSLTQETLNGTRYYIIHPRTDDGLADEFRILLPSAANTLHVIRMSLGSTPPLSLHTTALHLLALGMEFRLCLRNAQHLPDLSPDPRPPLQNRYTGLGFRSIGFIPDLADYEIYVELRRRFLSSPRGRCACFAGGVIGRLARSEITDEDLDFHKGRLAPREENVLLNEIRLWDGHSSTAYWDDALEDQEIDLICGVYEIATGRFENGEHQTSRVSWWPKPNAFSHSGLNIGFWSLDCEYWFQHRLAKIRSGEEKVHTQAEWKNCIRYYRKARDLAMANERIAGEFLSGVL